MLGGGKESIGSNSTPPSTVKTSPFLNTNAPPAINMQQRQRERDTCFKCKAQGHWAKDCPTSSPVKPSTPPQTRPLPPAAAAGNPRHRRFFPCPCDAGYCIVRTSASVKNPGRQYYSCPGTNRCNYFIRWVDEVRPHEMLNVPICGGCGSGFCRFHKEKSGPNAGRVMFMCMIKEGHGSCGYKVWQDELENESLNLRQSTLTDCNGTSTGSSGLDYESDQGLYNTGSPVNVINTSQRMQYSGERSVQMEKGLCSDQGLHTESPVINNNLQRVQYSGERSLQMEKGPCSDQGLYNTGSPVNVINTSQSMQYSGERYVQIEKGPCGDQGLYNTGSPVNVINTSHHLRYSGERSVQMEAIPSQEEETHEPSRKHHKRLRDEGSYSLLRSFDECVEKSEPEPSNIAIEVQTSQTPMDNVKSSEADCCQISRLEASLGAPTPISDLQIELLPFPMNSVSMPFNCWMLAKNHENLSFQLEGWLGRLVFHQPASLMLAVPTRSFCSPDEMTLRFGIAATPTESMITEADKPSTRILITETGKPSTGSLITENDSREQSIIIRNDQLHNFALNFLPSRTENVHDAGVGSVMKQSISKSLEQVGKCFQNELLSLLGSMAVGDHEVMHQEANATFDALDKLGFKCQHFREQVEEYICAALLLSETEQAKPSDDYYQRLVNACDRERMMLERITVAHSEAVKSLVDKRKRLEVVQEEISRVKDWLFQFEAEVSCFQDDIKALEDETEKVNNDKDVFKQRLIDVSKEVEENRQREAEFGAAKAVFDRARISLFTYKS